MNLAHLSPFANHVWQSTGFAGLAMLLSLLLRGNHARMRHWLWLAASLKFLIPFGVLMTAGSLIPWRMAPVVRPPVAVAITGAAQPFAAPARSASPVQSASTGFSIRAGWLTAVWLLGCAALLAYWCTRWWRIRTALRGSLPLPVIAPIEVRSSPSLLEPGVFGVFRPVLLMPDGIRQRLTPSEFQAILAHEMCHVRHRDNLTSALHMVVEAVFWFHPLVWWIGSQLVEERERACDEEVLCLGADPEIYASGILNVCKFFVESPLPCAAGVTGADLKKRVERIMARRTGSGLSLGRRALLAAVCAASFALPVAIGLVNAPKTLAQMQMSTALSFEVASIKPSDPSSRGMSFRISPGFGLNATGLTLQSLVEFAYNVQDFQVTGGPVWYRTERYDVLAKPDKPEGPSDLMQVSRADREVFLGNLRERTRRMLAERFQLAVHRTSEERPVYLLVPAKGGHKLKPSDEHKGLMRDRGLLLAEGATTEMLASVLGSILRIPVLDRTGLEGSYGFRMEWSDDAVPMDKDGLPQPASEPDPAKPTIFTALQERLGLKLESNKGPIEILVIDRAEKPSAN